MTVCDKSPLTLPSPPNRLLQLGTKAKRANTQTILGRGDKVALSN